MRMPPIQLEAARCSQSHLTVRDATLRRMQSMQPSSTPPSVTVGVSSAKREPTLGANAATHSLGDVAGSDRNAVSEARRRERRHVGLELHLLRVGRA